MKHKSSLTLHKYPWFVRIWRMLHLDFPIMLGLSALVSMGLIILYSASNQDWGMVNHQIMGILLALVVMVLLAQISPDQYRALAPWFFCFTLLLLFGVLALGVMSKGAQRWLSLGFMRFQPSEMMKIAMPMMLAWYLNDKNFPPDFKTISISLILLIIPVVIIAKQPDLGTAIIILLTGIFVLFLAGMSFRYIVAGTGLVAIIAPIMWHFMHDYQRKRIMIFLNSANDPRGGGYHIIQSKIAIGSGGFFGKGWLQGSQTHLQFLPEHSTDFIFAVCGEELGLLGCLILYLIFAFLIARGLYISSRSHDTFARLLSGSLTLTFFVSF